MADSQIPFWLKQLPDDRPWILRTAGGIRSFTSRFAGDQRAKDWASHWAQSCDSISILRVSLTAKAKADTFKQSQIVSYNGMTILLAADGDPSTVMPVPSHIVKCKDGYEATWNFQPPGPVSELPLKAYLKIRDSLRKQYGALPSNPWWQSLPSSAADLILSDGPVYNWRDLRGIEPTLEFVLSLCTRGILPSTFGGVEFPNRVSSADLIAAARLNPRMLGVSEHAIIQTCKRHIGASPIHRAKFRGLSFPPLRACRLALQSVIGPIEWSGGIAAEWRPMPPPPSRQAARRSASVPAKPPMAETPAA